MLKHDTSLQGDEARQSTWPLVRCPQAGNPPPPPTCTHSATAATIVRVHTPLMIVVAVCRHSGSSPSTCMALMWPPVHLGIS